MSEEQKAEDFENQPAPPEGMVHIQTLFSRLTELILSTCLSRRAVADAIVAIGKWSSVILASLILMVEQNSNESAIRADQITEALNREIKTHLAMLRGLKKKQGSSELILPRHLRK